MASYLQEQDDHEKNLPPREKTGGAINVHPVYLAPDPLTRPIKLVDAWVRGTPAPQGSKRLIGARGRGKPVMVEASTRARPWRELVVAALIATERAATWDGPASVSLRFCILRPKTVRRAQPTVAPDVDKLARLVLDALQLAGVVRDDAQVVQLYVEKVYADEPGLRVIVEGIE